MSDLTLEDPNNTAEALTGLHATTPHHGDFSGDCILQVAPNTSGNRTPQHFVDGIQGISSLEGGRGVVGEARKDFPGVSGDARRIGVLGNGDNSGVMGLVGFREAHTIPGKPVTVTFPSDPGTPSDAGTFAKTIITLPVVGVQSAAVVGLAQNFPDNTPSHLQLRPHAGVFGVNLGSGDGVVGHSATVNGVRGITTSQGGGRGGFFESRATAQVRLLPLVATGDINPTALLPANGMPGDLVAITATTTAGTTTGLWFCRKEAIAPSGPDWFKIA
jgi:hypothetical protein